PSRLQRRLGAWTPARNPWLALSSSRIGWPAEKRRRKRLASDFGHRSQQSREAEPGVAMPVGIISPSHTLMLEGITSKAHIGCVCLLQAPDEGNRADVLRLRASAPRASNVQEPGVAPMPRSGVFDSCAPRQRTRGESLHES